MYRLAAGDGDPGVRAVALAALAMHGTAEDAALVASHIADAIAFKECEARQLVERVADSVV